MRNLWLLLVLILSILNCGKSEYEQAREIYQRTAFQNKYKNKDATDLTDAISKLENFLKHDPENFDAKILLYKCYIKTDNPESQHLYDHLLNKKANLLNTLLHHFDDRDEVVRQHIVTLIGDLKDKEAALPLITILEQDEYQNVQRAAAEALGKLKDKRAVPSLLKKLDSPHPLVRHYAVSVLKNFNDDLIIQKLLGVLSRPDEAIDIRHQAALSLGAINNKLAEPELVKIFQAPDQPPESKLLAAIVLGMLGNPIGFDFAMNHVTSDQPYSAGLALTALGYSKNPKALPVLLEYLSYGNKAQRAIAAEALGNLGDARAIPALKQAISDPIPGVAEAAQQALNKLNQL